MSRKSIRVLWMVFIFCMCIFHIQCTEAAVHPVDPNREQRINRFYQSLDEVSAASQDMQLTLSENNGVYTCEVEGVEGYYSFQLMRKDNHFQKGYELVMIKETSDRTFHFDVAAAGEYTIGVWVTENEGSREAFAYSQYVFTVDGPATVESRINEILAACPAATDYDKAVWLHDWLINHAKYDNTYSYYGSDGVLLRQCGVCDSYSKAYYLLLKAAGIDCLYVGGGGHAWNAVKLNGEWCWIDVTWDDPVVVDEIVTGSECHYYFGLPSEILFEDHTFETIEDPADMEQVVCPTYENHYFIRKGDLLDAWCSGFVDEANEALSAGEKSFSMHIPPYYRSETTEGGYSSGFEHIVYNLVSYALGKMDLQGKKTNYVYADDEIKASTVPSIQFSVKSEWKDGTTVIEPDDDTTAIVYLKRDNEETGDVLFLSKENNWSGTTSMEYVENAQYGVSRAVIDGYLISTSTEVRDGNLDCTITFKKKAALTQSVTVQGRFVKEDGETEFLPDTSVEIPFRLMSDDKVVTSSVLKGTNNWKVTISGLPENAVYSVEEDVPDGFVMDSIRTVDGTTTITNRKVSSAETVSFPVTAYWYDTDGAELAEPPVSSLYVYLTNDEGKTGDVILLESPDWTGTFTNLDKMTYGVTVNPQDGFTSSIRAVDETNLSKGYAITLRKSGENDDEAISVPVYIEWDGEAPSTAVTVYLVKDGVRTGDEIRVSADSNWTGAFADIVVSGGSTFFVEEDTPAGYTMTFRGAVTDGKVADGFRIVNKKDAGMISPSQPSRLIAATENTNITLQVNTTGSCQWQYSADGGKTWQNCIGESATTQNYVFSMQESLNGRKYRCQVGGGYSGTFVTICVRSDDPYEEDVLYLPDDLTEVKDEGFKGVHAYTVIIPAGVKRIGSKAFAGCSAMRYVKFRGNDCEISEDAFEGTYVIFLCEEGSKAAKYAAEHDIPYLAEAATKG